MSDTKSRPLAPAPPGANAALDAQQRRKNVGTACAACKARKLKCTGSVPCANCVKSKVECTLDRSADKRRRGALKRKIDQLADQEELLVRLVGVLRESGNRRAVPLINIIRSDASLDEIRYYINHQLPRLELAQTPELVEVCEEVKQLQPSQSRSMRRILDAKRLSDIPRFQVPARPWTTVVSDNDFVSHLLSLWFTWSHPFRNWIDKDLFVRDMQEGSLSARFCSPFLVNIILADACAYSDYPEIYAIPGDPSSKGARFYEEAKRLLDKEEGRITLPTVQGLGVLWACASMTGRDRQGWIHRGQLAYAVQELLQKNSVLAADADEDTLRMVPVINRTVWGLFNISTSHALADKSRPLIKPPQRHSLPPVGHEGGPDEWRPYPDHADGTEGHSICLFNTLSCLSLIAYDVATFFHGEALHRPRAEIESKVIELREGLRLCSDRWPACLKTNLEAPHILCLHMYHDSIIMAMYEHLKDPAPTIGPPPTISPAQARETCFSSARNVARLIRSHRSCWGFDRMPVSNIQCITAALFTLLDDLEEPNNREAFITLSVAAKAFSRRWESSRTVLGTLRTTAHERGVTLPSETDSLFTTLVTPRRLGVRDSVDTLDDSEEA
ncbi:putative C6 transcription factor [Aspergillus ibericus CBS 121593]|uniref:C6 transcription factor n=1 Tax=Aspergillus ibericus CBS 121593 TaxID=1448316 RepID=A0A395H6Q0_9EURO|nr:C6 transcription factor [Aspergillus ibericus CBS 121593]RAL03229.1 C6 transcription factor [Aspergillus ibericus CBS 121593]